MYWTKLYWWNNCFMAALADLSRFYRYDLRWCFAWATVFGVLTGITSGVLSGFTTDIFSLYYSPVQMITGLLAGIIFYQRLYQKKNRFTLIFWAFVLSLPGTILSSLITVKLFGGITSSGSSMIVQLLHGLGMNLTMSTILVQAGTDYLDRLLSLILVAFVVVALGKRGRIGSQLKENQQ